MSVEEFDYEIEHRAGSRMNHVDALIQYPVRIVCNDTLTSKLKKAQEEDDNIETLKSLLEKQESEEFLERNVLTKLSLEDSTEWCKYVDRLQRILNSTICRSTKWTPFEQLVGTKRRNKKDILIKDLLLEEMAKELLELCVFLRNNVKKNIETLQSDNRKTYNKRRKKASFFTKKRTINVNFVYYRIPKQRRLVGLRSAGANDFLAEAY
ncbi:integrase catalytic domain-containing protein [Trichonephila clavipes]|nr:integrase catalytic domain-containing protein [Trichonephila clavipes]